MRSSWGATSYIIRGKSDSLIAALRTCANISVRQQWVNLQFTLHTSALIDVPTPLPESLRKAIACYEAGKAMMAYMTPEFEEVVRVSDTRRW